MSRDSIIPWSCSRCREGGNLAKLPETTLAHVRIAVTRGHERRSRDCHAKRGITKVKAVFNGQTISFAKIEALLANAGAVDGEDSTTATHTIGGSMQPGTTQQAGVGGQTGTAGEQTFGDAHGPEGSKDPNDREVDRETGDPIMRFFGFSHLPPKLQGVSQQFYNAATWIQDNIPRSAERTVALRKLLEGKDAAVRAAM